MEATEYFPGLAKKKENCKKWSAGNSLDERKKGFGQPKLDLHFPITPKIIVEGFRN